MRSLILVDLDNVHKWFISGLNEMFFNKRSKRTTRMLKDFLKKVDWLKFYKENSDTMTTTGLVSGDSLLQGKESYRVYCTVDGDSTIFDIDTVTFIPLRETDPGKRRVKLFYDYRRVQGRTVPFRTVIYEKGKKSQEIIWDRVEYNIRVGDSLFTEDRPRD